MKTRNGFVSNSSSSSFMLASDKDADEIEMSLTLKTKLSNILEMTIKTKEDLLEYFSDLGFLTEEDIFKENFMVDDYKACLKAIKDGKKVHVVSISSDGTPLEATLYDDGEGKLPESPDYKVISK